MKSKLIVGLLMGLSCLAFMHLMAASNVSIKFGKATKEFVIRESYPTQSLPNRIEVQGTTYLLDLSRKPDLKDYKSVIIHGDASREMRYDVTGSLEYRPAKTDEPNSPVVPVIVVKKLSSGLVPFTADATLETQHYFSRR